MVESVRFTRSQVWIFANPIKILLVTKEKYLGTSNASFGNTGVQVTSEGRPRPGASIGSEEFVVGQIWPQLP